MKRFKFYLLLMVWAVGTLSQSGIPIGNQTWMNQNTTTCPENYHVPSQADWNELLVSHYNIQGTADSLVNGVFQAIPGTYLSATTAGGNSVYLYNIPSSGKVQMTTGYQQSNTLLRCVQDKTVANVRSAQAIITPTKTTSEAYNPPTVTVEGVEMATIDYVDAQHPDGWFHYSVLDTLTIPEGWYFPTPGDYYFPSTQKNKCTNDATNGNGLNWELIGRKFGPRIIFQGRITYYWSKARNDFYSIKVWPATSGRSITFEFDNSSAKNEEKRIRLVRNHSEKIIPQNLNASALSRTNDNLKIYLGFMPDPDAVVQDSTEVEITTPTPELPSLVSGMNTITLPAPFDGMLTYEIVQRWQQSGIVIIEIWDMAHVSQYWRYNAQYSACWSEKLTGNTQYKILVQ